MKQVNFAFILILKCASCTDPFVLTPRGPIRGQESDDGSYVRFLGIPYGVVDQKHPFGKADPHPMFDNTFIANDDTEECPQMVAGQAEGTLDCLRLNIFAPRIANSENRLPVIVFIHGGAFVRGSKNKFGPKFLVKHDVILVIINYRLGPYGFLCLSTGKVNNQGFKDQRLGLQWVKDNINAFGGDSNKITVFGQSAGGMSIDLLLLHARAGLFSRVIVDSGPAITPWAVAPQNDKNFLIIAKHFGFVNDNITAAVDYLSKVDPINLMNAASDLKLLQVDGYAVFKPCVEGKDGIVLQDYPVNMNPDVRGLDIMVGNTNNEIIFLYPNNDTMYYENFNFGNELANGFDDVQDENIVKEFYIGEHFNSEHLQKEIMKFGSDFAFNYPTDRTVNRYLENGANKVYRYMFAYEGGRNIFKNVHNYTSKGAAHADDLPYLFDAQFFKGQPSDRDQKMINIMTELWTNFAKYGDPTPSKSELIPVKWDPTTLESPLYLHIDLPLVLRRRPFSDRMAFWDLYYKLHGTLEKGRK